MARIAYVSIAARGHVIPSLAVVRELADRGHQVEYLAPESCRELVQIAGVSFHPYSSSILSKRPKKLNGFVNPNIPIYVAEEINTAWRDVLRILERLSPDIIVYDGFTFSGMFAAMKLGIPAIRAESSVVPSRAYNFYRQAEAGGIKGSLTSPSSLRQFDELMRPFFAQTGLAPMSFHELVAHEAPMTLVYTYSRLHPNSHLFDPDRVRFLGLSHDPRTRPLAETFNPPDDGLPLVYVAFGSIFHYEPAFYYICIEALERLGARVFMSVGELMSDSIFEELPPNFVVRRHLPQIPLLRHARLAIIHGGMGTTVESLACGVPLLVVPQFPEQYVTAVRIAELGLGLHLDRDDVSIRTVHEAAGSLLNSPAELTAARTFAATAAEIKGPVIGADAVEEMLSTKDRREARGNA